MTIRVPEPTHGLLGIGLYTPAEAERLIGVPAKRLIRWLRGHDVGPSRYDPLWTPQVDIGDGRIYLGFRDLMEARVAAALVAAGLSARKVRRAIVIARGIVGDERPLSSTRLRTDGSTVFLERVRETGDPELIDVLSGQHVFIRIFEPSLRDLDYEHDAPARWWPAGRGAGIVVDPARRFGAPIDDASGVPTSILADAVTAEGSVGGAARRFLVTPATVRRAIAFEQRKAA